MKSSFILWLLEICSKRNVEVVLFMFTWGKMIIVDNTANTHDNNTRTRVEITPLAQLQPYYNVNY